MKIQIKQIKKNDGRKQFEIIVENIPPWSKTVKGGNPMPSKIETNIMGGNMLYATDNLLQVDIPKNGVTKDRYVTAAVSTSQEQLDKNKAEMKRVIQEWANINFKNKKA